MYFRILPRKRAEAYLAKMKMKDGWEDIWMEEQT